VNQRSHYIITLCVLIPTAILAIARIEKYLLDFLLKGRQFLMRAHVAVVEVPRLSLLVAHLGIALDEMLGTCYSSLRTSSQIHVLVSPEE
jgi:hypothetical protein